MLTEQCPGQQEGPDQGQGPVFEERQAGSLSGAEEKVGRRGSAIEVTGGNVWCGFVLTLCGLLETGIRM